MTDQRKAGGAGRRADGSDFDLVEDIGDAAAFDRALDELVPRADLGQPGRFDVDPDDFEAFNRELDAQMAQVRARTTRQGTVEDLGVDVVARPTAPPPSVGATPPPAPAPAQDEPDVADDVVTLRATTAPARPGPPVPEAAAPPSAAASRPARAGRGAGVAVLLGLAGLTAGGAALWISLEREAELTRLRAELSARDAAAVVPTAAPPAPGADTERVRELEGRLEEVSRRVAELASAPAEAPQPEERAATPPNAHSEAPAAAPPVAPVVAKAEPKPAEPAAKHPEAAPPVPAARVEPPASVPAPASASAATASSPAPSARPAPEPSPPSTAAAQSLPKPSGSGSWAVVIDSFVDEGDAEKRRAQIERMTLPAEVRWFLVKDEVRYRIIVPGYSTQDAANTAAAELRRRKAGGAYVMRMPKPE